MSDANTKMILQALSEFREDFTSFKEETRSEFKEVKSQVNKIESKQDKMTTQLDRMEILLSGVEENQPKDIMSLLHQIGSKVENNANALNKRVFRMESEMERLINR